MKALQMEQLPEYIFSSFRSFVPNEKHVTRICGHDVLVIVFEGVLRFEEAGIPISVKKGEYYIQQRGMLHEGVLPSDSPRYYYLHFLAEFTREANNGLPIRGKVDVSKLFPLFEKLDFLQISGGSQVEKSAVFYQILSALKEEYHPSRQRELVAQVIQLTTRNKSHPLSLEEIAARVGYSKNHIINVFKAQTGETPIAYFNRQRLETAKQLLLHSELTLEQISHDCGFGEYINFYKAFAKAEGISPLKWRKQTRVARQIRTPFLKGGFSLTHC